MKYRIIRINHVSDIDTSKVTIYDLNNRYIDPQGSMYSLRYDKNTKKIEVIRIMRTHLKNAPYYQKQIIQNKIHTEHIPTIEDEYEPTDYIDETTPMEPVDFDPDLFIKDAFDLIQSHKQRLSGIKMNIKKSNVVPKENKADSNELEDIFRNMELDGIQSFDNLENYEKELVQYPRSITYYQAKIDKKGRDIIESMAGDNQRIMRYIYVYEMYHSLKSMYRTINKIVTSLKLFLDNLESEGTHKITQLEQRSYQDAMVSIDNTIQEIEDLLDGLKHMDDYVYDPNNF